MWKEQIRKYITYNEQEEKDKQIFIRCIDTFPDILTRVNEIAHITSSAFMINVKQNKVLMVHHNIYNAWSWTGGHADGEHDLLNVAIREAKEETGIVTVNVVKEDIFSLDVIQVKSHIKSGKYVAPHLHLSVAYLLTADESENLSIKEDENSGVKWVNIDEMCLFSNEAHMIKIYEKLIEKLKRKI